MATLIKGSISAGNPTGKVSITGKMEKFTMESGRKAVSQDTGFGRESKVTAILERGKITKQMAMESTFGLMETDTKENGLTV